MPRELLLQLLRELYPTVSQDGEEGEAGGGGSAAGAAAGAAGAGAGEAEDENVTIRKLREEVKAAERRLKAVEGLDPKVYKEATEKVDKLERELREREALTAAERQRLEQKANEGIQAAKKEAETERAARVRLQTHTLAKAAFEKAQGQDGADDDGRTYFDGFMSLVGERHLRLDDNGALYVVDAQGDPVQSPDGKGRISPAEWMKSVADKSPVVGTFFKSQFGTGSGMQSSRGVVTRGLPALKDLTPGQRRDLAWGEPA